MDLILDADPEDLRFWLLEANEQLQVLDEDLIRLEWESDDSELLQRIFRAAHTLKGSSGTIKHNRMAHLTHAMEGVLDELRNEKIPVTSALIDVLLDSLDNLGLLKDEVTAMTVDETIPVDDLVDRLNQLRDAAEAGDASPASEAEAETAAPAARPATSIELSETAKQAVQSAQARGDVVSHIFVQFDSESALLAARKLQVLTEAPGMGEVVASAPTMDEVMEENDSTTLEIILISEESEAAIQNALSVILDVKSIEISEFGSSEDEAEVEGPAEAGPDDASAGSQNGAKAAARAPRGP